MDTNDDMKILKQRESEEKVMGKDFFVTRDGSTFQLRHIDSSWLGMKIKYVIGTAAPGLDSAHEIIAVFETDESCEPSYRSGEYER